MRLDGYDTVDTPVVIASDQSLNPQLNVLNVTQDTTQSEVEMNACYTIHRELLNSRKPFP